MKRLFLFCILLTAGLAQAQQWVSTTYQFATDTDVVYGSAMDFGGVARSLTMDISVPTNDTPPSNGRPLMILIHGGAFIAGSKADAGIVAMREDFAKRGYVTAAINYRLGMFHPAPDIHCNASYFLEWDCLNVNDSLEWTRAYYRGIQDAHGAIRYLVNHAAQYNLDPQNVFVVGESAGAFIAMGVGFMDDNSEKPAGVGSVADAQLPNSRYEQACLQRYGTGTTNGALNLVRPNLNSFYGTLNQPTAVSYRIRGVGDLYGAVFNNLFAANANDARIPCLYIYHQPNDLIVPFNHNRVLISYSYCCVTTLACVYIYGTPYVSGGNAIKDMIDALALQGHAVPDYQAEFTSNMADCAAQFFNPSVGGHQFDNYGTRTNNMAVFFAPKIDTLAMSIREGLAQLDMQVYPNPSNGQFRIVLPEHAPIDGVTVSDLLGKRVYQAAADGPELLVQLPATLARGTYILQVETAQGNLARRIVLE